jgi:hypothetical protein
MKLSPEFSDALKKVLQVSKKELNHLLVEEEKERRLRKDKPGPKPTSSARASYNADND